MRPSDGRSSEVQFLDQRPPRRTHGAPEDPEGQPGPLPRVRNHVLRVQDQGPPRLRERLRSLPERTAPPPGKDPWVDPARGQDAPYRRRPGAEGERADPAEARPRIGREERGLREG